MNMQRVLAATTVTLAVSLVLTAGVLCADWPQYLGPNRNGISPETGLARAWPAGGPKVLWTTNVGEGFAGPAVSGGKVYLLDRIGAEKDALRCFDLATGKEEWSFAYDAPGKTSHPGSRSVPAIDDKYVFTCGPFGDVYCFDKATHQPVWKKNLLKDYGGSVPTWGISQNPVLHGNAVIVAAQTPKAGVVAFDKATGAQLWASQNLPGRGSYVSPTVVNIGGVDQVIMISSGDRGSREGRAPKGAPDAGKRGAKGKAPMPPPAQPPAGEETQGSGATAGLDPATGKALWEYRGFQCQIPIANVTSIGDGRLFITGGYGSGSVMIKVEKKGAGFEVRELFRKSAENASQTHPAILFNNHLYMNSNSNERRDGMQCLDLDGNLKWKTGDRPNFERGGYILADGLIYNVDGKTGILHLVEPNPQGYKELAQAKLLETKEPWAPLALSDGKLVIRDQATMKCLEVK